MEEGKMALNNGNITGLNNNKTVWTIYAPTVTTTQHQSDTSFSGDVQAQLFTDSTPRAKLTTKLATYNDVAHQFPRQPQLPRNRPDLPPKAASD